MDSLTCITLESELLNILQQKVVIFTHSSHAINSSAIQSSMYRTQTLVLSHFIFSHYFFSDYRSKNIEISDLTLSLAPIQP